MPIEDDGGVLKGLGRTDLRGQEVSRLLSREASLSFLRAFLTADFVLWRLMTGVSVC